jgi:archaellum component FlaC
MKEQESDKTLKNKWANFWNVIFDPWVVSIFSVTLIVICFAAEIEDKKFQSVMTIIIAILSSIFGGIIANRWAQYTEFKVLVVRGKSAVRSLKLILLNVSNVGKRTKHYISDLEEDKGEYKLIKSNFEEIVEKCNILEEEILSSIENWTDIIPEIKDAKNNIGLASQMKIQIAELEKVISELNKKLVTVTEEGSHERTKLLQEVAEKEKARADALEKLKNAEIKINTTILGGIQGTSGRGMTQGTSWASGSLSYGNPISQRILKCKNCGKLITMLEDDTIQLCDECKRSSQQGTSGVSSSY